MGGIMEELWKRAQIQQGQGLMSHLSSQSAMPQGEIVDRAGLLPYGVDEYGRRSFALPQAAVEAVDAFTLPGRVMEGYQPTMEDVGNMALTVGAGGLAGSAPKGALRSGAARSELPGFTAYHGSPHSFDKFSMDKIGTGEGVQAYGHGLYFAENEGVARAYKDALKMKGYDNNPMYAEAVSNHGFGAREFDQFESLARTTIHDPDVLAREFFSFNDEWKPLANDPVEYKNVRDFAEKYIKSTPEGSMYEVRINADPEQFLDWDKPLSEQSEAVQRALEHVDTARGSINDLKAAVKTWEDALMSAPDGSRFRPSAEKHLQKAKNELANAMNNMTGADIIGRNRGGMGRGGVEEDLSKAGIPGIKYLDQGSRVTSAGDLLGIEKGADGWKAKIKVTNRGGAGFSSPTDQITTSMAFPTEEAANAWAQSKIQGGTSNYVAFDDSIIEILRKYGWAGIAPMAGGIMANMPTGEN